MAHSCSKTAVSLLVGMFRSSAVASPLAALDHWLLAVHMLKHLLLVTPAPPLIWLGGPVRPLLLGLPERFVESLLDPSGQCWATRWFAEALGNLKFASVAACAVLVGWHVRALFASAK